MEHTEIFKITAPLYWGVGMSVIPLKPRQKKPQLPNWQTFQDRLPSLTEQQFWLERYAHGNIGLVLGPQSGVVVVDIDTEDPVVRHAIDEVLAPLASPWQRIGKKGVVLAYKNSTLKPFKIRNTETSSAVVEILGAGNQVVLPPSIHPDTQKPYVANVPLYEVRDQLIALPDDIEYRLRNALTAVGVPVHLAVNSVNRQGRPPGPNTNKPRTSGAGGLIADGRNDLGTSIRARVFIGLRSEDQLTLESFTRESWIEFTRVCSTEASMLSGNTYTYEQWARNCTSDFRRLSNKIKPKGKLIDGVAPAWTADIVTLTEGVSRLHSAIDEFFALNR